MSTATTSEAGASEPVGTPSPSAAAEAIAAFAASSVPPADVHLLVNMQAEIHQTLRASNMELAAFNSFSAEQHNRLAGRFAKHADTLRRVHSDLLAIFRRTRALRSRLLQQHPELTEAAAAADARREADIERVRGAAGGGDENYGVDSDNSDGDGGRRGCSPHGDDNSGHDGGGYEGAAKHRDAAGDGNDGGERGHVDGRTGGGDSSSDGNEHGAGNDGIDSCDGGAGNDGNDDCDGSGTVDNDGSESGAGNDGNNDGEGGSFEDTDGEGRHGLLQGGDGTASDAAANGADVAGQTVDGGDDGEEAAGARRERDGAVAS